MGSQLALTRLCAGRNLNEHIVVIPLHKLRQTLIMDKLEY